MLGPCYIRTVKARKPKVKYEYFLKKSRKKIVDAETLAKLDAVKIPATYTNVTICPNPKNKLLGTAYDGTGRKQYFYSDAHKERATRMKYCNLVNLGKKLPYITKDINHLMDQGQRGNVNQDIMDALALQVMLLCNFRVGSRNNRNKYHTYGLTTITRDHVRFNGGSVNKSGGTARIKFTGKKQQINDCVVTDTKTVNFLKRIVRNRDTNDKNMPLFSYKGVTVTPESLNEFLSQYNPDITTKTWRTWFANIRFIEKVFTVKGSVPETKTARKRLANEKIKEVAEELHHTAAINKKNYLIKELPELYVEHPDAWSKLREKRRSSNTFLMEFLKGYCKLYQWDPKLEAQRRRKGGAHKRGTEDSDDESDFSDDESNSDDESDFSNDSDDDESSY